MSGNKGRFIEWMDELPPGWGAKRLGSFASVKARLGWKGLKAEEYVDDGYIFLSTPNLKAEEIDFENVNYITEDRYFESPEIMLREGDVLMVKDGATLGIVALVKNLPAPATVNGSTAVIRTNGDCDNRFLCHWLRSRGVQQLIDKMKGGMGVPHLFQSDLRRFPVAFPPLPEQGRIATYLDEQTARIDRLMDLRRRQMELLKEQRAALIQQAVTRGLNPDAPMKDSGLPWLGEIPAHWTIAPVNARYEVQLGKMLDSGRITGECLAPYLRNVDVQWDFINTRDLPVMDFSPKDRTKFALRAGDLLVCEGGELGRAAIWSEELSDCYYQKALHRLRPRKSSDHPRFMYYLLRAAATRGVFESQGGQATIGHLPAEVLRRYRFAFAPEDEQIAVVKFLDAEQAKLDLVHFAYSRQLDILSEYRDSLIHECVTGQRRVGEEIILEAL